MSRETVERELERARSVGKAVDLAVNVSCLMTLQDAMAAVRRRIHTEYICPPIPIRAFDWAAYFDDYDGAPDAGYQPVGNGATEVEAIFDLLVSYVAATV
jgi:hypothetical protein